MSPTGVAVGLPPSDSGPERSMDDARVDVSQQQDKPVILAERTRGASLSEDVVAVNLMAYAEVVGLEGDDLPVFEADATLVWQLDPVADAVTARLMDDAKAPFEDVGLEPDVVSEIGRAAVKV